MITRFGATAHEYLPHVGRKLQTQQQTKNDEHLAAGGNEGNWKTRETRKSRALMCSDKTPLRVPVSTGGSRARRPTLQVSLDPLSTHSAAQPLLTGASWTCAHGARARSVSARLTGSSFDLGQDFYTRVPKPSHSCTWYTDRSKVSKYTDYDLSSTCIDAICKTVEQVLEFPLKLRTPCHWLCAKALRALSRL